MRNETLLRLSAVVFAVLWILLTRGPLDLMSLAMLTVCGAIAGLIWYWLYGKWFRWYIEPH